MTISKLVENSAQPVEVQETTFSIDVLGRYICSTWDEAVNNGGAPFDVVVIGAGMFGGAGVGTLMALGTLTACLVAALATAMDVWLAALIMTVVWAAVAGALALSGRKRVSQAIPPVPEQTVDTLKEDVQWAKTQLPSGTK